jgi:hypothetical protein
VFFISNGEREFSLRNAAKDTLVVASGIDVETEPHASISIRDGALTGSDVDLQPSQWWGGY